MKKANVVIIEDGLMQADRYAAILQDQGINVSGIASNFEDGQKLINAYLPDLALVDINLGGDGTANKEDTSGIQLGKWIKHTLGIPFIYVTAYGDQETLQKASNTGHVSYLYKPVNDKQLFVSVQDALFKSKTITIKFNYQNKVIYQNNITRIEANKNDLFIHTSISSETFKTRMKISDIEEELYDFMFIRCHKSHIVNINHVDRYSSEHIFLSNIGKAIPIGPTYRQDVIQVINRH